MYQCRGILVLHFLNLRFIIKIIQSCPGLSIVIACHLVLSASIFRFLEGYAEELGLSLETTYLEPG